MSVVTSSRNRRHRHRRRAGRLDRLHPARPAAATRSNSSSARSSRASTSASRSSRRRTASSKRLNMLPKMKGSHFVKKYSVQFVNQHGKLSEPFYFIDHKPHESSQTWQVRRSEFDHMHARTTPASTASTSTRACACWRCCSRATRAVGVRVKTEDGTEQRGAGEGGRRRQRPELDAHRPARPARVGPGAEEGRRVDLLEGRLPRHRPRRGRDAWSSRPRARRAGSGTSRCTTTSSASASWPAYDYLFQNRGDEGPARRSTSRKSRKAPGVQPRIENATRCDIFRAQKEYSYRAQQAAGDGWVLVRRRVRLPRPALLVRRAAGADQRRRWPPTRSPRGWTKGDTSEAQLGKWEPAFVAGMDRMRRLVCEFYDGFSFGRFVKKHPHLKGLVTDVLIGDVFKDEVDVLWPLMDELRAEVAAEKGEAIAV